MRARVSVLAGGWCGLTCGAVLAAAICAANAIGAVLLEGSWPEAIAWALAALLIIPVVRRLAA